ncbi:MAG: alanyl-tRNA editing protein [Promethearchaeota archaeon]|jgi:alanyl-tRNA synthetase
MTKKLYWESPYETKFSAKVDSIMEDGIILDQTLFYPESGNQHSDRGILKIKGYEFKIDEVTKEGDDIKHNLSGNFQENIKIGDKVEGEIDWEYRFGLMRAHSSQHVFSAVLKKNYDIDTIRANLNFEEVFLQISKKVDVSQLKEILYDVNTICTTNNLDIKSRIVPREEVKKNIGKIRSRIPNESQVRLMEIENLDLVCCGGTHVHSTTEIGSLFIFEFKGGNEIRYYVGNKAVSVESNINVDMITLVNELNNPIEKLREIIVKRLETLKKTQNQLKNLSIMLVELISKSPSKIANNIPLFYIDFNIDLKIINKMLDLFPQDSLLIVEMGTNKLRVFSLSDKIDANEIIQKFVNKYQGKGGGNQKSAQAKLKKAPKSLLSEIEQFLK